MRAALAQANARRFAALGDPTRLQVFALISRAPLSVAEVAAQLPVSRPAVSQHLKVLADAGLVSLETVQMGALQEVVYSVTLKPNVSETALLEAVRAVNDNQKVSLIVGQHEVDL